MSAPTCRACHEQRTIKARGLCVRCYSHHKKAGTLDTFARINQPQPAICTACKAPERKVETKGLCHRCLLAARRREAGRPTLAERAQRTATVPANGRGTMVPPLYVTAMRIITETPALPVQTPVVYTGGPTALYPHLVGQRGRVVGGWPKGVSLEFPGGFRGVATADEVRRAA